MKQMNTQEKILRLELDADMKMQGLKIVDYELYQRYETKRIMWTISAALITIALGFALGIGGTIARAIFG